ncbi:hypothetical protein M9H77_25593 [Catharanthus roseus]|uniref:Uncharacterized protein n=1 Tax=Catharanthus roseus TaxID=4058 RepID=A0ACC0A7D1_CATRO|nr:hypothetical protein M9H77_25593 [Catharanthus roseus]
MKIHPQYKIVDLYKGWRYGGYDPFVLPHQAEQVSVLSYLDSKRPWTDWVSVMKYQPRVMDNVEIGEGPTIDALIEDVGPLVHYSRSLEELDIDVETYFEELQNDEIEIEWVSDEYSKDCADDDTEEDFINENDEDSDT